mgnify:CR=1 FL=1
MSGLTNAAGVELFDQTSFEQAVAASTQPLAVFRATLQEGSQALRQRFEQGEAATPLVQARAHLIDELLQQAWRLNLPPDAAASLVAVGGYGRSELHPASDIDVLILLDCEDHGCLEPNIEQLLMFLWDIGLEIGHSVRTPEECGREAERDITIATNLLEARLLAGDQRLFHQMGEHIAPGRIWSSQAFFEAKRQEQEARHHKYGDTAYNLEPNVKGSPGGLRDIQMIGWVAKRHFGTSTLAELVDHHFLTPGQLQRLEDGQAFLWRIRFALHVLTGRREDRLLFDHQKKLAETLGYEDAVYMLAVEQLMQRYYRTVMELSRLNEMLLQLFEEAILMDPNAPAEPLNNSFKVRNGYLQTVDDHVFERDPSALLEMFVLL